MLLPRFLILFCIFLLIFIKPSISVQMKPMLNIGTVLFTHADSRRECYSADEVALLTSRMMFQDLLPTEDELQIQCNENIMDLIEYFRIALSVVRCLTFGRTKHIILMAITDTLGGYMRHLVLPLAKYAYYAGQIRYSTVIKLYQLYDELKLYLRTDGQGWKSPREDLTFNMEAEEISLEGPPPKADPCKGLIYAKGNARATRKANLMGGEPREGDNGPTQKPGCDIQIPMPFFDSKTQPSAIAVPFKTFTLRNLQSRSSAYILVKLYMAVLRCMSLKNSGESSIQRFDNDYFNFLTSKVMPRLKDEKFYAAFGGVLRVMSSLRKSGYLGSAKEIGNYNVMPLMDLQDREEINEEEFEVATAPEKPRKSNWIVIAAMITIAIWFILGALFICCKMRSSKSGKGGGLPCSGGTCRTRQTSESNKSESSNRSTEKRSSCLPCLGKSSASSKSKSSAASESGQSFCTKNTCPKLRAKTSESSEARSSSKKNVKISDSRGTSSNKTSTTYSGSSYTYDDDDGDFTSTSTQNLTTKQAYFPTYYACHSSLTGNYKDGKPCKTVSSTEDETDDKKQFVFGYDFRTTTSDSSQGDEMGGEEKDLTGHLSH